MNETFVRPGQIGIRALTDKEIASLGFFVDSSCPIETADAAIEAVTSQCGETCHWSDGGSEDCLCNKLFPALQALRAHRNGLVPL